MSEALSSNDAAPRPRLCHLRKWPDFNGYGFNLHAERGKAGQFIGNVDPDSPAVAANLRPGDRIVQVGYVYMSAMTHVTKNAPYQSQSATGVGSWQGRINR